MQDEQRALYTLKSFTAVAVDEAGREFELTVDGVLDQQQSKLTVLLDKQDHPEIFEKNITQIAPTTSILTVHMQAVKHSFAAKEGVMFNVRLRGRHRKED